MNIHEQREEELLRHCKGCRYFEEVIKDDKDIFRCILLESEMLIEEDDEGIEYIPGSEGVLAVAKYNADGEMIDFEYWGEYPEDCPRKEVSKDD